MEYRMELQPRPQNLQDLEEQEQLKVDTTESAAVIEPNSDEEIWIFNIPKTIDPEELKGQKLSLKKKSCIMLNGKEYESVKQDASNMHVPCVYKNDNGELQAVTILPEKTIQLLRKL